MTVDVATILAVVALITQYDLQPWCTTWIANLTKYPYSSEMSVDDRRDEKGISGYILQKREVLPPAILALYTPDVITAACHNVLSDDT